MKFYLYVVQDTKLNSKWVIDLNIKPIPIKFLGENFVILDLVAMTSKMVTKYFLDTTKVPSIKIQINKLDVIKSGFFCSPKYTINSRKISHRLGKIFAIHISNEVLLPRILKYVQHSNKETSTPKEIVKKFKRLY